MSQELKTQTGEVVALKASPSLVERFAARYAIEPGKMLDALKQTAFMQKPKKDGTMVVVSNEQMLALLAVAEQYGLNPFVREIYAFPSEGGIVPIVPVDGWIAIINRHPSLDSIEVAISPDGTAPDDAWCEVTITRKDRSKPITIREYLKECYRDTGPWNSHPRRMLRHKAIIQASRVAFGYSGIFDPDEAERIYATAIDVTPRTPAKPKTEKPRAKRITEQPAAPEAETVSPAQAEQNPGPINREQFDALIARLDDEGIHTKDLCNKYHVAVLADLSATLFEPAMAWLAAVNGPPDA